MEKLTSDFQQLSGDQPETSSSVSSGVITAVSDEEVAAVASSFKPKRRAGRTKFRETRHPVYRGVRQRNGGKWVCEVREPNKKTRIWLGTFPTPEMAARAHDVAALALRGPSACLNFADSVWRLPTPASSSPRDIQRAAGEAAEAFLPQSDTFSAEQPEILTPSENVFYMDEEALFGMHNLIDNMAEGLLLSPPANSSGVHWDDVECYVDLPLWSHSI